VLTVAGAMTGVALFGFAPDLMAQDGGLILDLNASDFGAALTGGEGASTAVKLLVTLSLLSVAPAIVLSMTSFTRLIVVFSLLRQAVGVQQAPPNQVLVGLALFLTWFVMAPTFDQVNELAVEPYFDGRMSEGEALTAAMGPMRQFMMRNTREKDLGLMLRLSHSARPETRADVPTRALVPAFMISELKTAFQIGFLIYIPFLIIDLVVSTVLLAMGMMVLPPIVISLPFKLLLFVFVDGWNLLIGSLVTSFA
jgi:flagellar biosynthetic protein FliP